MKKNAIIVLAVVIVIAVAAHFADKATRLRGKTILKLDNSNAGEPAPDVSLKDLDGKDVTLSQFKGKVVLVNFWATWCDPCRVEIPWLIEMQQKYSARGFTVLGISMDEEGKAAVDPFLAKERFNVNGQKLPMNYPIVIGNDEVADK